MSSSSSSSRKPSSAVMSRRGDDTSDSDDESSKSLSRSLTKSPSRSSSKSPSRSSSKSTSREEPTTSRITPMRSTSRERSPAPRMTPASRSSSSERRPSGASRKLEGKGEDVETLESFQKIESLSERFTRLLSELQNTLDEINDSEDFGEKELSSIVEKISKLPGPISTKLASKTQKRRSLSRGRETSTTTTTTLAEKSERVSPVRKSTEASTIAKTYAQKTEAKEKIPMPPPSTGGVVPYRSLKADKSLIIKESTISEKTVKKAETKVAPKFDLEALLEESKRMSERTQVEAIPATMPSKRPSGSLRISDAERERRLKAASGTGTAKATVKPATKTAALVRPTGRKGK